MQNKRMRPCQKIYPSEHSPDAPAAPDGLSLPDASGDFSHRVIRVDPHRPEPSSLRKAAQVIREGGLVIFPTDTLYGLGCSAFHEPCLDRIFSLKERPSAKPLPVLVSGPGQLAELIRGPVSALAHDIIQEFWPGALTLIFQAADRVLARITGGTKTIGVRMPGCQLTLDLINLARVPLAATSVNISGRPVHQEMRSMIAEWAPKVELILDAGAVQGNLASTVLDLTTHPPRLLREGAISARRLHRYLGPDPEPDQKQTG
ncbi:MAG: L-threonylcarbamoyladenylate synthase [bacterium]